MQKVFFHNADKVLTITGKTEIKEYIPQIFKKERVGLARLDYIFCSDDYLLDINQRHLNHDYYTDIITFDLSETASVTGEIYISLDRVKENSVQLGTGFRQELLRVIFHGALHLCGYKDKSRNEKVEMREKEQFHLDKFL